MKNKWIILVIALSLVAIVGIGGKYFMDERTKAKEKESIEVERQSVMALKNTFSEIDTITFKKTSHDISTNSYRIFITLTSENKQEESFSYSYSSNRDKVTGYPIKNKSVQSRGITESQVNVIYSDGSTEVI